MLSKEKKEAGPQAKRTRLSLDKKLLQEITIKHKKSIWLPTECWVDTLKLLSRRELLQRVQPVGRRLHYIAELHVPNVHIVRHLDWFFAAYARNRREAKRQCAELAASQAALTRHFRLSTPDLEFRMDRSKNKRRSMIQMCVLRHSVELFRGCALYIELNHYQTVKMKEPAVEYLDYLSLLAPARPFLINIWHDAKTPGLHPDELLRESVVMECPRLTLYALQKAPNAVTICQWLHHIPKEEDESQNSTNTRILNIIPLINLPKNVTEIIEWCKQSLQQAGSVSDRRSFLFNFEIPGYYSTVPPVFKLENHVSGEVLLLEQYDRQELNYMATGQRVYYHFRRCPMAELANAEQFYRDTFWCQTLHFRLPMVENGRVVPNLSLRHKGK